MQYIYLILFLAALYFLVRYWDKKKQKDLEVQKEKRRQSHLNCLLNYEDIKDAINKRIEETEDINSYS